MILYRYILREILITTLGISFVLLLVIVGSRFARLLGHAASGAVSLDALGMLTVLYLPYAAQLLLPLSFVLGLMVTLGRMYAESEMYVIESSGVSQRQIMMKVFILACVLAGFTGFVSLYLTPLSQFKSAELIDQQSENTGFDLIAPGEFTRINTRVFFVGGSDKDSGVMKDVFIIEADQKKEVLTISREAYQQQDKFMLNRYVVLEDGKHYDLPIHSLESQKIEFSRYAMRIAVGNDRQLEDNIKSRETVRLLADGNVESKTELQWRVSLPLMVFVMVLIAYPFVRVNPRGGRFFSILPVVFLQMIYLGGLMSLQGYIVRGAFPLYPGLYSLHILFAALGLLFCYKNGVMSK